MKQNEWAALWNWLNGQIRELDAEIERYHQQLKNLENRPELSAQTRYDLESLWHLNILELHAQQRGYEKTMLHLCEIEERRKQIWMLE